MEQTFRGGNVAYSLPPSSTPGYPELELFRCEAAFDSLPRTVTSPVIKLSGLLVATLLFDISFEA